MKQWKITLLLFGLLLFSIVSLHSNSPMIAQNQNTEIKAALTHDIDHQFLVDFFNIENSTYLNTEGNDTISLQSTLFEGIYDFGDAELNQPLGMAVNDSGFIYVADTANARICVYFPNRTFYFTFGSWGYEDWQFSYALAGIATDSTGNIYTVDRTNSRVQKFTASGQYIWKRGGIFSLLWDIAVNSTLGYVYVGDNTLVQVLGTNSTHLFDFGTGHFTTVGSIAINATGAVYVSEGAYHRMVVFNSIGTYLFNFSTGNIATEFHTFNQTGYLYISCHNHNHFSIYDFRGNYLGYSSDFTTGTDLQGIAIYGNFVYIVRLAANEVSVFFQNKTRPSAMGYESAGSYMSPVLDLGEANNWFYDAVAFGIDTPSDSAIDLFAYLEGIGWSPIASNQSIGYEFGRYLQFYVNLTASSDFLETPSFCWLQLNWSETVSNEYPSIEDITVSFDNETMGAIVSCKVFDPDNDTLNVTFCLPLGTILQTFLNMPNGTEIICEVLVCEYDSTYTYYFNVTDGEAAVQSSTFSFATGAEPEEPETPPATTDFLPLYILFGFVGIGLVLLALVPSKRK